MENATEYEDLWLCLSGGNALGAYHAGLYEVLHRSRMRPTRIAGASIGAVTGAIIAGNDADGGVERLREYWTLAKQTLPLGWPGADSSSRRYTLLGSTFSFGRPGLFRRRLPGVFPFNHEQSSLFDASALISTLSRIVDFGRLNDGPIQFIATAVDAETGEDIVFDNRTTKIGVDHLLASTAFPVAFAPVEIQGRAYLDPGLSANLPLRALFSTPVSRPTLCVASDLFPLKGAVPASLDEAVSRAQDLIFSRQTALAVDALRREFESAAVASNVINLLHIVYQGDAEIGGKMLDFTEGAINRRWASGAADMERALMEVCPHGI